MEYERELIAEQRRFGIAKAARNREYEAIKARPAGGGADVWTNQVLDRMRRERLAGFGDPESSVAFGRIDLISEDSAFYIGNRHIEADEIHVLNWRAPAAELFYVGKASDPELLLRRKFTTHRNTIESFQDDIVRRATGDEAERVLAHELEAVPSAAARQADDVDDSLLRSLEQVRDGEMREIAATIQAAQYEVMISSPKKHLIVQGGAGTGKTAVALHRVSWLLYTEQGKITPPDVLIVGPSERFNAYIRSVLPSLGDAGVRQATLSELGPVSADGGVEDDEVARVKGDARWVRVLRRAVFSKVRVAVDSSGSLSVGRGRGSARFERSELMAQLRDSTSSGTYMQARARFGHWLSVEASRRTPSRTTVDKASIDSAVKRMWPDVHPAQLLRQLLANPGDLRAAASGILSEDEIESVLRRGGDAEPWSVADVALMDELQYQISGRERGFKHVVVDEAQDLSPMQLRAVTRRVGSGSCTLVGDIAQSTGPYAKPDWSQVLAHFGGEESVAFHELLIGYRVPKQVFDLASRLLSTAAPGVAIPRAVRRGPAQPGLHRSDAESMVRDAIDIVQERVGDGLYVGVIGSSTLLEDARVEWEGRAVLSGNDGPDVSFLTARQAKGLEFESVILLEPAEMLDAVSGSRDLYIGATRTTGYLDVVYSRAFPVWDLTVEPDVSPIATAVSAEWPGPSQGVDARPTEESAPPFDADPETERVSMSARDALLDYLEAVLAHEPEAERKAFAAEVASRLKVSVQQDRRHGLFGRRRSHHDV
jgi:DNA helicase IV